MFRKRNEEENEEQILCSDRSWAEKFNRLDDARLSNTGGAGLGLSIAEEIIHLHGGKITASSQNETIDFVITLPLSAQENKNVILGITQEFKRIFFEIEKPLFGTMIIEQGLFIVQSKQKKGV